MPDAGRTWEYNDRPEIGPLAHGAYLESSGSRLPSFNMDEHIPVLFEEVLQHLAPRDGGRYIDGTVGAGGHSEGLLRASAPQGRLLAIDRDAEALRFAQRRLAAYGDRVTFVHDSYGNMGEIAPTHGFNGVDGILLDLGLSSRQLHDAERGFSFLREGPLDMRFDRTVGQPAAELVNHLDAAALADIFWRYGDERHSRRYARAIIAARPVTTTTELAAIIEKEAPGYVRRKRIHPATQVFQALRIAVNGELDELERGLPAAVGLLRAGGRVGVISFHSLEDRFVKNYFRDLSRNCVCPPQQPVCTCEAQARVRLVTRKPVAPTEAEAEDNPRSRSARFRVAEKLIN